MYGVGLNPIYIQRMEEREAKRAARGDTAKEEFDKAAQEKLNVLFDPTAAPLQKPAAPAPVVAETADGYWELTEGAEITEIECPTYMSIGEELAFLTPDGDREYVVVPEWAEIGGEFTVALAADGEWRAWRPKPEEAAEEAAEENEEVVVQEEEEEQIDSPALSVVDDAPPVAAEATRAEEKSAREPAMPVELPMPSTREMEEELVQLMDMSSLEGRVTPTGAAEAAKAEVDPVASLVEPTDDIFAAIYADPNFGDGDDVPLGLGEPDDEVEPPPPMLG